MSRILKFRIYSKRTKNLYSGDELHYLVHIDGGLKYLTEGNGDYIIQQFTGLIDKNGVEIFEGDLVNFIVKGIPHGPEVEYFTKEPVWYDNEDACWYFGRYTVDGEIYGWSIMGDNIDRNSFEVIGNIFENK